MKRILTLTLLFFISGFAFSAGYRGTYWGETMPELADKGLLFEMVQDNNYVYMREQARVLGQSTNIWYCLSKQKLVGICYTVEDTPQAREQIDKLLETRKLKLIKRVRLNMTEEDSKTYLKNVEEETRNTTPYAALLVDDVLAYNEGRGSMTGAFMEAKDHEESNIEFIKSEFNGDTEVHIISGVFYGYILVAYTETPQDF